MPAQVTNSLTIYKSLENLEIPPAVYTCLRENGISTTEQLMDLTEFELFNMGMTRRTVSRLKFHSVLTFARYIEQVLD